VKRDKNLDIPTSNQLGDLYQYATGATPTTLYRAMSDVTVKSTISIFQHEHQFWQNQKEWVFDFRGLLVVPMAIWVGSMEDDDSDTSASEGSTSSSSDDEEEPTVISGARAQNQTVDCCREHLPSYFGVALVGKMVYQTPCCCDRQE
jgi:hypothetical protein